MDEYELQLVPLWRSAEENRCAKSKGTLGYVITPMVGIYATIAHLRHNMTKVVRLDIPSPLLFSFTVGTLSTANGSPTAA